MAHAPATHLAVAWLIEQALPQLPQLLTLLSVWISQPSMLTPLQSAKPGLHLAMAQARITHVGVPLSTMQVLPHCPQLLRSMSGFEQAALQQFQPPWQMLPQPPQFWKSLVVSAHCWLPGMPQHTLLPSQPCIPVQPGTHTSLLQTLPSTQ